MRVLLILRAALLFATLSATTSFAQIVFVDKNATGPTHDGSSWCAAYTTLQDALVVASAGQTIRMADGIYTPDTGGGQTTGDRNASFALVTGVTVEGGYAGCGAPNPNQRDFVLNETILSGDLNGDDGPGFANNAENAYTVVSASGVTAATVVDGVTITAGNSDRADIGQNRGGAVSMSSSSPHFVDVRFFANSSVESAGAVFAVNTGTPAFLRCTFESNTSHWGGAIDQWPGTVSTFDDCTFSDNSAIQRGGVIAVNTSSASITGGTFTNNSSGNSGGVAWVLSGGNATFASSIFNGNTANDTGGAIAVSDGSGLTLNSCNFQDNTTTNFEGGAINVWSGGSIVQATNCSFVNNTSGAWAGAMATNGATVTLTGCTFTGNQAPSANGGAAEFFDSNVTLTNCAFSNNQCVGIGGAVFLNSITAGTLDGCTFDQNLSAEGGAIRVSDNGTQSSIRNCTFTGNSAGLGGAMIIGFGASPTIEDCTFSQNNGAQGGAINIQQQSGAVTTIRRCDFTGNTAGAGAGLFLFADASTNLLDCRFQSNQSTDLGSAVDNVSNTPVTATNCLFADNSAGTVGTFLTRGPTSVSTITNCTFTRNSGVTGTGGVWSENGGTAAIVNSILWGNVWPGAPLTQQQIDQDGLGMTVTSVNHSLVQGGWSGLGGIMIVNLDPLFVDPDGPDNVVGNADDSFRLVTCSPAINVGDNLSVPSGVTTDLDGNPRIVDGVVDLGAYEHATSPDCNGNNIPDECDIVDCGGDPACDDCNNNGVPDACDISTGTSLDTDVNGIPDECQVWDDEAGDNKWSTDANWIDNTAPALGAQVVIDGNVAVQANVDLDIPVSIDLLRLRNNATLNVTGAAGEDLTITSTGGLVMAAPEMGIPQASLLVAADRSISVTNGPVILDATALYQAAVGSSNVSAALSASTILIREGFPAGEMILTDTMSVTTTGDFVFRYQPAGHVLPPAPCGMVRAAERGGVITRPRLRAFDASSISIGGDLVVRGGANITVAPGVSFVVGGSIINEATVCPNEFDLSKATLTLGGSPLRSPAVGMQRFEVAGQNLGPVAQGFANNFEVGALTVAPGADVSFVDQFDNNADGTSDALYVGNLVFDAGSVITFDNSKVYFSVLTDNAASVTFLGTGGLVAVSLFAPTATSTYPHAVAKNRYLSFVPDPANVGVPHTYKITHVGSGQSFFISPPQTTPTEIAGLGYTFVVADPDPVAAGLLFDYGTLPIVHVGGCLIAPGETYEVRATTDGVNVSAPLTVTTAAIPTNGRFWADAVGVFTMTGDSSTTPPTPASAWTPPNGIMNGFDVAAALRGFQKLNQPDNTWTDVNGLSQDRLTNGNDILRFVNAFSIGSGKEFYPFPTPATCTAGSGMDIPPVTELAP